MTLGKKTLGSGISPAQVSRVEVARLELRKAKAVAQLEKFRATVKREQRQIRCSDMCDGDKAAKLAHLDRELNEVFKRVSKVAMEVANITTGSASS